MDLLRMIWRDYRAAFVAVLAASVASAALGIGVIAFINQRLIETSTDPLAAMPQFFGLIGLLLVVSLAAQIGLTVLGHRFVFDLRSRLVKRTPMIQAIGALPTLINAQVAFDKLASLSLADYSPDFDTPAPLKPGWQTIELRDVTFAYGDADGSRTAGFTIGPINLTLRRGELVFLIGGNGSGKTTLARLLTGLYWPAGGAIRVDDVIVNATNQGAFRRLFAAVFTDFYLFDRLLGADGVPADAAFVDHWRARLGLTDKLRVDGTHILDSKLSQGQRKRVALMLALAESRGVLLLDEWAADQDPQFRRVFYHELLPAFRERGHTVFAISHDDSYFEHADRLLEMRGGQLYELTGELRERASRDAVARIGQ